MNGKSEASPKSIDEQATRKQGDSGMGGRLGRYTRINLQHSKPNRKIQFLAASTRKVSLAQAYGS